MAQNTDGIGGKPIDHDDSVDESTTTSQETTKGPVSNFEAGREALTAELADVEIPKGWEPLEAVEQAYASIRDFADNTFQGDLRTKEEILQDRKNLTLQGWKNEAERKRLLDEATFKDAPLTVIAREGVRAPIGGVAASIENLGEGAEFLGDTAKSLISKTGIIEVDEEDIPWSSAYESAHWDLGVAENKTAVGNFSREMIGLIINMKQLAGLGIGIGGGATIKSRLASETLRGAIVDFVIDPGEGNLSNIVQDSKYANILSKALAHKDDDNQYIQRLKNMVEGGTIGIAVDGLTETYSVIREARRLVKTGIPAESAVDQALINLRRKEILRGQWEDGSEEAIEQAAIRKSANYNPEISNKAPKEGGVSQKRELVEAEIAMATDGRLKNPLNMKNRSTLEIEGDLGANAKGRADWQFFRNKSGNIELSWDVSLVKGKLSLGKMKTQFKKMVSDGKFRVGETLENHPLSDSAHSSTKDKRAISEWQAKKEKLNAVRQALIENPDEQLDAAARRLFEEVQAGIKDPDARRAWDSLEEGDEALNYYRKQAAKVDPRTNPGPVPNKRSRIYERMGFGPLIDDEVQYARVVDDPEKGIILKPVGKDGKIIEPHKIENDLNSAKVGGEGKFEPQERQVRVDSDDIEDVVESFAKTTDSVDGSAKHASSDADFEDMNTVQDFSKYIEERAEWIDIDEINRRLGPQAVEYHERVLKDLASFALDGRLDHLENLLTKGDQGIRGTGAGGAVILDTLVKDTSNQLLEIANVIRELDEIDADFSKQALDLLERQRALVKLKKESTIFASYNLQNWKDIPLDISRTMDEAAETIDKEFDKITELLKSTDIVDGVEVKKQIRGFVNGLIATNGDPTRIWGFWENWRKYGMKGLNQAAIQAWLSSPVSQMRNIAGNTVVAIERPFALAAGHALEGDWKKTRAALSMFDGFFQATRESFAVAKESIGKDGPITEGSKVAHFEASAMTQQVEALKGLAKTPAQKYAANILGAYHSWNNTPWNTWPGKGLQAGDDMFKSLVARMDIRYQAALEADALGDSARQFDIDSETGVMSGNSAADKYTELLQQKLGPNGEINDKVLLDRAKEATFQKALEGDMKKIADAINDLPVLKQFVPFVKTPHNVNVYALQHIPGLARFTSEYKAAMKPGADPQLRALMKGREAMGVLLVSSGATMAGLGLITGNGPSDPKLKKIWLKNHAPMSFKIPGTNNWVSYKSVPGADVIFSAIADTQEIIKLLPEGDGDKLWNQLTYTIANSITNRAYFAGFTDLSGALDPSKWGAMSVAEAAADRANTLIGSSGFRNQFENVLKSGMHEYRNTLHAVAGKLSGGILGDKVPTIDILTGEQMVTGYENPFNAVNPFRVASKNASPLEKDLAKYQYRLSDAVVTRVNGVDLTVPEQQEMRRLMYDDGNFPKALSSYINSRIFKAKYKRWLDTRGTAEGVAREESDWYADISKVVNAYRRKAKKELLTGSDPISIAFRSRIGESNVDPIKSLINIR